MNVEVACCCGASLIKPQRGISRLRKGSDTAAGGFDGL